MHRSRCGIIAACTAGLALGIGPWWSSFDNWFLGDDIAWLAQAKRAATLPRMVLTTPWDAYFRPTHHAVFWCEWRCFGTSSLPYHLTSVTLHIAAALLLWGITRRLRRDPGEAWAVAGAFLGLSVGAEAVIWISGQTVLLATVLAEAALFVWICADSQGGWWRTAVTMALFLMAVGSSVAVAPVLLAMLWVTKRRSHLLLLTIPLITTMGVIAGQGAIAPEVSGRATQAVAAPDVLLVLVRSWVEACARVIPTLPWALAALLFVTAALLVRPSITAAAALSMVACALGPYVISSGRHIATGSTVPFDRYFYGARPCLAFLTGGVMWRGVGFIRTRSSLRHLWWIGSGGLCILWLFVHTGEVQRWDLVYGRPSHRLRQAILDIRRVDPGPPNPLYASDLALPECWLVGSVGDLFFDRRLHCGTAHSGQVRLWRDEEGRLLGLQLPPEPDSAATSARQVNGPGFAVEADSSFLPQNGG